MARVTSHQRLDSVKNDEEMEQKTQQYKEKQYLIRDPIVRYRFIFGSFMVRSRSVRGPSTVRQRSVRGPSTVRSRSVYGTSGFFEMFCLTDGLLGRVGFINLRKEPRNAWKQGIAGDIPFAI
jgi:hypothetical protein